MNGAAKTEETLTLFRAIVNSSRDAIFAGTPNGTITIWNAAAERLYGYAAEEIIGQSLWLLVPPNRRDETAALLAKLQQGEGIETFDTVRRRKDGSLMDVSMTLSPIGDASGRTIGFSGIVRDITEHKRAEEAVALAKREWERTFDSMPDLVAILDVHHRIVHVNRAMAERLGVTPQQCIGQNCFEGVHGQHQPPDFCPHILTLADGKQHTAEVHEERLGGDFLVTTTPLVDEQGQVLGSVHVARDITERKKAREALEKEHRTLKHLLDSSDHERQMIAYEIHDGLAQQLAAAIMQFQTYAYLKDTKPDEAARAHEAGVTLLRQGHLEARRLISGVRSPILDESGIIAAVAHLVSEQRLPNGPKIEFRSEVKFDRLLPTLENAIYRIVQEGLTNALRHSKSQRIRVALLQRGDVLQIEVQDWGEGFDPARVEADHFGLEGIRQRARLLGGSTSVESAPGQGTCLTVELPLVLEE
jgi:PAS domain S-box-containing protein